MELMNEIVSSGNGLTSSLFRLGRGLEPWNGPSVDSNLNRLGIFNGILTRSSLFDFVVGDIRGW